MRGLQDDKGVNLTETWPSSWVGTWTAQDGKTVTIGQSTRGMTVTVRPAPDQPSYLSAELLEGGTKRIERLPASCQVDNEGRRYLEIEAGSPGLGPTYRLYAAVEGPEGLRKAHDDAAVDRLVLVPNTMIGLYDDWDDDLGVPWAYPLDPRRWRCAS
jgi:hypothetical protein